MVADRVADGLDLLRRVVGDGTGRNASSISMTQLDRVERVGARGSFTNEEVLEIFSLATPELFGNDLNDLGLDFRRADAIDPPSMGNFTGAPVMGGDYMEAISSFQGLTLKGGLRIPPSGAFLGRIARRRLPWVVILWKTDAWIGSTLETFPPGFTASVSSPESVLPLRWDCRPGRTPLLLKAGPAHRRRSPGRRGAAL